MQTSLLVVPHYHSTERIDASTELCQWLRRCQEQGHEIVLHGWTHQLPSKRKIKSGLNTWFFENFYTAGEAEFLTLDYTEAMDRISRGLEMFRALRLDACGFIAPAWLMNPEVERAARDCGLSYSNTISEWIDLKNSRRIATRSCVWSSRAAWRRGASILWNRTLFSQLNGVEPLRISLHPCDLEYPAIWGQIKSLVRLASKGRAATTYAGWMNEARSHS